MRDLEGAEDPLLKQLMRLETGNVFIIEKNPARGRPESARNDVEQRCFASAIGANQTGDGARRNFQAGVIHGPQAAKKFMQILDADHCPHSPDKRRSCYPPDRPPVRSGDGPANCQAVTRHLP